MFLCAFQCFACGFCSAAALAFLVMGDLGLSAAMALLAVINGGCGGAKLGQLCGAER